MVMQSDPCNKIEAEGLQKHKGQDHTWGGGKQGFVEEKSKLGLKR